MSSESSTNEPHQKECISTEFDPFSPGPTCPADPGVNSPSDVWYDDFSTFSSEYCKSLYSTPERNLVSTPDIVGTICASYHLRKSPGAETEQREIDLQYIAKLGKIMPVQMLSVWSVVGH